MENNNSSNNIVNLQEFAKEREINAYLNLMRLGKVLEVINIDENGIVDIYEFGIHRLGFVFGFDFVTFEEKPQIYPINFDMDRDEYYTDDEPGIYVSKLYELDEKEQKECYKYIEKHLDLAKSIEKMYFDKFIKDDKCEYSKDSRHLYIEDEKYFAKKECQIIDFNKSIRRMNQERIRNLVKGNKHF